MPRNLDTICRFSYELVLLLTLAVLALAPFHSRSTLHFNITKMIDARTASFIMDRPLRFAFGDTLPVYRFNPGWTAPIGQIKVTGIKDNEVICYFDPATFRWPMGRQGRVVESDGSTVKVDIGSAFGLKANDHLILFKERKRVGRIKLTETSGSYSYGQVIEGSPQNLTGLTASEFIIPTQAVVFKNDLLSSLEIFFFLFIIAAYSCIFIVRKTSPFILFGNFLMPRIRPMATEHFYFFVNLLLCFPFVWFITTFAALSATHLAAIIANTANRFFHIPIPANSLALFLEQNMFWLYLLGSLAYLYVLFGQKRSPILRFWDQLKFRPKNNIATRPFSRDIIIWALHVLIAYAFGQSLFIFLRNNLSALFSLAWPSTDLSYILTHPPQVKSVEDAFSIMRYFLWSLTIVGCLWGYGHSIFGYLWGKRIRNLDFTLMGWVTSAICYGPLLGMIIWRMVPSFKGPDPIMTPGPLNFSVLIIEFLLNLLYTLSIWNLGTMFGVLTDKGVRTSQFYSVVRHPSYTLEALMFVIVFLNGLSTPREWMAIMAFILTYYIRSEREDQFMSASNPEYAAYKTKTPYKFIPGVY